RREPLGLHRDEVAARDHLREAVDDDRGGERGDERVHATERDEQAVADPAAEPDEGAEHERAPQPDARVQEDLPGQDRREAGDGADGEVEAAADEDERAADRDDADGRRLEGEVLHVRQGDEQPDEGDDDAVVADDGDVQEAGGIELPSLERDLLRRRHATLASPPVANAACRRASSLIVCSSSSATILPPRMTSTRCARPRISSCSDEMSSTPMPSAASERISS